MPAFDNAVIYGYECDGLRDVPVRRVEGDTGNARPDLAIASQGDSDCIAPSERLCQEDPVIVCSASLDEARGIVTLNQRDAGLVVIDHTDGDIRHGLAAIESVTRGRDGMTDHREALALGG